MVHATPQPSPGPWTFHDQTDDLLVRPPVLRDGLVHRGALINRLRAEHAAVLLVTAPAGYGKTTLLAQWALRDAREFAWVRIAEEANDPRVLLSLLVDSLAAALGPDDPTVKALSSPAPSVRSVTRRLGRALFSQPAPLVIVLDNIDVLVAPETLEIVATVCDHLAPETQLVLCGRSAPKLPLARLRAEGRLAERSAVDLRLSDREAVRLLHLEGVDISPAGAKDLNRHAEGWPTGVYLSALALKAQGATTSGGAAGNSGADHFVSEYFASEVLERLEPKTLEFALHAALLKRMAGPICDAVLGTSGSGARLDALAAAGAFLIPLDREHTAFRFHSFFRETLLSRLEHGEPSLFAELSRRAAAGSLDAGDVPSAIEYLRGIGDRDAATELLGATVSEVFGPGLVTSIGASIDDLRDEQLLVAHQPAAIVGALSHALLGHAAEADRWASAAAEGAPAGPLVDGTATSAAWGAVLRAALCRDGLDRMGADATVAVDQVAHHTPMAAFAVFLLGVSQLLAGAPEAESRFAEAAELAQAVNAPLVASLALAELSLLAGAGEEWGEAEDLARRARDHAAELAPTGHAGGALAHIASVRSALRNSNWVRAGDDIEQVHQALPRLNDALPWLAVQVRVELAAAHLALNDLGAAAELSSEIDRLVLARPHLGALRAAALELRETVEGLRRRPASRAAALTAAELRLLPLLTTHLTFRQIAQHLYVSRNTIKTQAISVYRKLGVSSRTEAIDRAIELGLLRPESEIADAPEPTRSTV